MNPISWLARVLTASRAAQADVGPAERAFGITQEWTPTSYLEYYATSPVVYAAVNIKGNALARARLVVSDPAGEPAPTHPLQKLFDAPNQDMTGPDLLSATEIYLSLAGRAHWAIETGATGQLQLWPLRPDRLITLPGEGRNYIKGFRYEGLYRDVHYLPEEVVTFARFNPLQDRTGLSPIAPLRQTADMGAAALKYNRETFTYGIPDFLFTSINPTTDQQYESFRTRWMSRFAKKGQSRVPALIDGIQSIHPLAFSQREMEFIEGLQWVVEETARVQGVPQPLLGSLREATLANVKELYRIFWHLTMMPEAGFLRAKLQQDLLPKLGYERMTVEFDFGTIELLDEDEEPRTKREVEFMDRGAMTINEVREGRGLQPIEGGDDPDAPSRRARPPSPFGTMPRGNTPAEDMRPSRPQNGHLTSHADLIR